MRKRLKIINSLIGATVGLLALGVLYNLQAAFQAPTVASIEADFSPVVPDGARWPGDWAQYATAVDANLFDPSRAPYQPPPPPAPPPAPPPPEPPAPKPIAAPTVQVVGTVISEGRPSMAIVARKSGAANEKRTLVVAEGDMVGEYRVQSIRPRVVVFERGEAIFEVVQATDMSTPNESVSESPRVEEIDKASGVQQVGTAQPSSEKSEKSEKADKMVPKVEQPRNPEPAAKSSSPSNTRQTAMGRTTGKVEKKDVPWGARSTGSMGHGNPTPRPRSEAGKKP